MQKNILVTGGAGYIGSIVSNDFIKKGFHVTCVDKLDFGIESIKNLLENKNFDLQKVDINNYEQVNDILSKRDYYAIIHLAAIVGDPACKLYSDLAIKTNWESSKHLFDQSVINKIPRFIFASTCSNYGKMDLENNFVDENSLIEPLSLYAELKVKFEKYILDADHSNEDISSTALRFSTVYGISPRMRFDLTVNEFSKELALGNELEVFGSQFWRPYCHVEDFSNAFMSVINAEKKLIKNEVFNVGDTSENYTKQMLIDEIKAYIPNLKINYVKQIDDPRDYKVNSDKIKNILNFRITKKVPDGIKEIIDSIKNGEFLDTNLQKYYNIPHKK